MADHIRDLTDAAAFDDSPWPSNDFEHDEWLFATAGAPDACRADALAGRGMSVVQWRLGDCNGCVRDLAALRSPGGCVPDLAARRSPGGCVPDLAARRGTVGCVL